MNLFTKQILEILVNTVYKLFINSLRKVFTKGILAILVITVYKLFINSLRKVFTKCILGILVNRVYKLFISSLRKVFTKENLAILVNKVYEFINKFINSMGSQSCRGKKITVFPDIALRLCMGLVPRSKGWYSYHKSGTSTTTVTTRQAVI